MCRSRPAGTGDRRQRPELPVSPLIDALRAGAGVRARAIATGLERFEEAIDEELDAVAAGRDRFKAVRGDYGAGKTYFARWLEHRARERGFATPLVQISETETPLYKLQTVYRRAIEGLKTKEWDEGLSDRWLFSLEEEVLDAGAVKPDDAEQFAKAVGDLMERRLAELSSTQSQYATVLRACRPDGLPVLRSRTIVVVAVRSSLSMQQRTCSCRSDCFLAGRERNAGELEQPDRSRDGRHEMGAQRTRSSARAPVVTFPRRRKRPRGR
ncbi:MAG: BREX system ATP-binding domain-containing protein [Kofleriaceae bacterium]